MPDAGFGVFHGDAFDLFKLLPDKSVNLLCTDPPYAVTKLAWDKPVDWDAFWSEAHRVCRDDAMIVVFSQHPFTYYFLAKHVLWYLRRIKRVDVDKLGPLRLAKLMEEQKAWFRYELIWHKTMPTGFLNANRRPLRLHENILVFAQWMKDSTYHPQKTAGKPYKSKASWSSFYQQQTAVTINEGDRFPVSVLHYSNAVTPERTHPTQKPFELMRWLIRSYSNPGDVVLDPFMGSGSTGDACLEEGRHFIGSELGFEPFDIALQRMSMRDTSLRF
jgi:DNA modification methylase